MTVRLGVIGAGAEGTVFEKSRGVCGRAAARRRDGIVYEYGANYLKDAGGRVSTLVADTFDEGLVEVDGPIWTFDDAGTVSEGAGGDARRWTYEDGITRLAKHLFGSTSAEVKRETRIVDVSHSNGGSGEGWRLADSDGRTHGPFDALLVTPPAPGSPARRGSTLRSGTDWRRARPLLTFCRALHLNTRSRRWPTRHPPSLRARTAENGSGTDQSAIVSGTDQIS
jgi:hypothetical protein